METNRQQKIAKILQKDLVEILQNIAKNRTKGLLISVTKVRITTDLLEAKVYLSVFPSKYREVVIKDVSKRGSQIKHKLAMRTRYQLKRVPNLTFYGDDSLDYIEKIENSLKGADENPFENPSILSKRKKI